MKTAQATPIIFVGNKIIVPKSQNPNLTFEVVC